MKSFWILFYFLPSVTDNVVVILIGSNPPSPRNRIFYFILIGSFVCVCVSAYFFTKDSHEHFSRALNIFWDRIQKAFCVRVCVCCLYRAC